MPHRLGIFCIYDAEGILDKAILSTIKDLRACLTDLVVVVNGSLQECYLQQVSHIASQVVIRPNTGFDAGAYKDVLFHHLSPAQLRQYDEFVFCNDTFYGPFIPFADIFREMANRNCDFWALSYSAGQLIDFLHSYFLCFHFDPFFKTVLPYMERYVREDNTSLNAVYSFFEEAMFQQLCKDGYHFASYALSNNLILYKCNNIFLRDYNLPILKKKFFSKEHYQEQNVFDALQYVAARYPAYLPDILVSIHRKFHLSISREEILRFPPSAPIPFFREFKMTATKASISEFLTKYSRYYIYGAGQWGQILYAVYLEGTGKTQGFVCSDAAHLPASGQVLGVPVFPLCDVHPDADTGMIVALGAENTKAVRPLLSAFSPNQLYYLYG